MLELNKLYLMDCMEGMKQIDDESIDLIATDCPYKIVQGGCSNKAVTINACGGMLSKHSGDNIELVKKGKIFKHNDIEFQEWLPDCYRVLKPNSHCYIMVNGRNLSDLQNEAEKAGFIFQNLLVWDKGTATPNKWYMNAGEFILFLRKGNAKNINNMGSTTILKISNIERGTKTHPTQKPVGLMKELIVNSSKENEIVLDPFMGVGTTALACLEVNRQYIGFEIDADYYNLATERLEAVKSQISMFDEPTDKPEYEQSKFI